MMKQNKRVEANLRMKANFAQPKAGLIGPIAYYSAICLCTAAGNFTESIVAELMQSNGQVSKLVSNVDLTYYV